MTYEEYRKIREQEVNELPVFWAFSDDQFRKAMEERGLTENDTDKIYALGSGGFYLRTDADKVRAFFNKPDTLHDLIINDPVFAEEAFYYEMCNHEYGINYQGDWDVCSCFCKKELDFKDDKSYVDYLLEAGYNSDVVETYRKARAAYYKAAEENKWY